MCRIVYIVSNIMISDSEIDSGFENKFEEFEMQDGSGLLDWIKDKVNKTSKFDSRYKPPAGITTTESLELMASAKRDANKPPLPPKPSPKPTLPPKPHRLISKKCFILDFDCTITYSHWTIFLLNYEKWKNEFLLIDPNYINLNNEQKNLTSKKLEEISILINKVIASNDKAGIRENIALIEKELDNTEMQLLLLTYIMGGVDRRNMICSFIKTLSKNGYYVAIASRGYTTNIRVFLNLMKIYDHITINAHNDCTYKNNKPDSCKYITKENYIISLYNQGYKVIRYIDDDSSEHNNLQKLIKNINNIDYKYYGSNIGLNLNEHGLTQDSINKIYADVDIGVKDICNWDFKLKTVMKVAPTIKTSNTKAVIFNMDRTLTSINWYTFTEKLTNIGEKCEKNIEKYFKGPTIAKVRDAPDEVVLRDAIAEYKKKMNVNIIDAIIGCVFESENVVLKLAVIKDTLEYLKNNGYDVYLVTSANYNYTILLLHLMDLYIQLHNNKQESIFINLIDADKIIAFKHTNPKGSNFRNNFLTSLKKTNYKEIYFVDSETDGIVAKAANLMPNSVVAKLYVVKGIKNLELVDSIKMQKGGDNDELSAKAYKRKYLKYKKKYLNLKS